MTYREMREKYGGRVAVYTAFLDDFTQEERISSRDYLNIQDVALFALARVICPEMIPRIWGDQLPGGK